MPPLQFDAVWKSTLEEFFEPFMDLCFPSIAKTIDWSHPIEWLDTELQKITHNANQGLQRVDKLIKVAFKDQSQSGCLIHLEIQNQKEANFENRIYVYNYCLRVRYEENVCSLVVYVDSDPDWQPSKYKEARRNKNKITFEFATVKLSKLGRRLTVARNQGNPVDWVIDAHLAAQKTMNDLPGRYQFKREMLRDLFQRGMPVKKVSKILSLIDWLMTLPENLEKQLTTELQVQQKSNTMIPISSFELAVLEQGIEKGRLEGRQEGNRNKAQEAVLDALETRFGEISDLVREQVQSLTDAIELKRLHRRAILVSDLNSFSAELVVPVG